MFVEDFKNILKAKFHRNIHCLFKFKGHRKYDYFRQTDVVILNKKIRFKRKYDYLGCECGLCFYDSKNK